MDVTHSPQRFSPSAVRYIKLGEGGSWFEQCLAAHCIRFADIVPHEIAGRGDWEAARQAYVEAGRSQPANDLRELRDFYEQPADCLWMTFGRGCLWWAFAEPEVVVAPDGARVRRTLAPWSCLDAAGRELRVQDLSTSLTQTAAYRRTICSVSAEAYLLRRLNAEANPLASRVEALKAELVASAGEMVAGLHWRDFEVLVDLIFARSGWRRTGGVGGSDQADSDLILEQAVTQERAFVQIKSSATAAAFQKALKAFEAYPGMDRFFFVCHTAGEGLTPAADPHVRVWRRTDVAEQALEAGLLDWLLTKAR